MSNYINISLPKEQRLGQLGVNISGLEMKIIEYKNSVDIDVVFTETNIIVKNKSYGNFLRGAIAHPIRYEESFAHYIEVELGLDINKIWNWEKNKVSPYEIYKCYNKKVWLYCQEKKYHNDGGGYEIICNNFYKGQRCSYCGSHGGKTHKLDSLGFIYPQIAEMIISDKRNNVIMDDLYKIAPQSNREKFYFKCNQCKKSSSEKKSLNKIIREGFSCEHCSDGISIPEKFMMNILKQLNIKFVTQLTKSTFEWCQDYRYDFYIPSLNTIIETHGKQHYDGGFERYGGRTLEEEQENDRLKKELALNNDIKNYIIIDCRKSEFNWLKKNVERKLVEYFNLSNINWSLIWEDSLKSLVWEVKMLHEKGYTSIEIAEILSICKTTVNNYKKQLGIEVKTKQEIKQENLLKIKNLVQQGKTTREIMKLTGLAKSTINGYKRELNL